VKQFGKEESKEKDFQEEEVFQEKEETIDQ
jgi:hypothetical protein